MRPNRPHIPSFITSSKSQKTKQNRGANLLAFPDRRTFRISEPPLHSSPRSRFPSRRFRPSPSLFRFGEPVFTETLKHPQEKKTPPSHFLCKTQKQHKIWNLHKPKTQIGLPGSNLVAQPLFGPAQNGANPEIHADLSTGGPAKGRCSRDPRASGPTGAFERPWPASWQKVVIGPASDVFASNPRPCSQSPQLASPAHPSRAIAP